MDNQHTLQPKSMTFYAAFTADRYARLWRQQREYNHNRRSEVV